MTETGRTFVLNCYTDMFYPNPIVLKGDNIVVPTSILEEIQEQEHSTHFIFSLKTVSGGSSNPITCKAIEFSHDSTLSGNVYIPQWMQQTLLLSPGDCVSISMVSSELPKGTKVTVQPQDSLFLTLDNHKSVLEQALVDFNTLTTNTSIIISHEGEDYGIQITDVVSSIDHAASKSVSIIDTDLEVEFLPPIDYIEFKPSDWPESEEWPLPVGVFIKEERHINPKEYVLSNGKVVVIRPKRILPVIPNVSLAESNDSDSSDESPKKSFVPFSGKGYRLGS